MIEQIKNYQDNHLAIEVIDGFTNTDEKLCQKLFFEKTNQGHDIIHILVKLDELNIEHSAVKSFFEDTIFLLRHYKQIGHLAIVAHSKILKTTVPIDNLFFERSSKGRYERYFDISKIDDAFKFIEN